MEYLRKLISNRNFYLFLIILLAVFLRFYQLGDVPSGLTNDETNIGYEAYSILLTGKDQWNNFMPLTNFKGFGDYPPPLYIYLTTPFVWMFGLNSFSVRITSAIFGVLSVIAIYFLGKKLFNEKVGIFSALFLGIMPWALGLSRMGIESNVGILFTILALLAGFKNNSIKFLYPTAILLALTMYTYSAYILFAPLVFGLILFFNLGKFSLRNLLLPLVIFVLLILPLFIHKDSASVRFSQVGLINNVNSVGLINTLNDERGQCLKSYYPVFCKVVDNKVTLYVSTFFKNYLAHFSPNFLYINGTVTQYSILPQRGLDYIFDSLLLFFGLYFLLRKNKDLKVSFIFLLLFLLSALPDSLTGDGNYSRASIMQPFIALIDGLGFYYIFELKIFKNRKIKYLAFFSTLLIVVFSITSFYAVYLTYFKNNYSIFSQYGYQDLMIKVKAQKNNYDKIYISRHLNDTKQYVYYLFYNKYSPQKYQSKKDVSYSQSSDGWISIDRIENIYFVQNPPPVHLISPFGKDKVLLISNPVDFPKNIKLAFVVKDKLGNVLFKAINLSDLLEYNKEQEALRLKGNI